MKGKRILVTGATGFIGSHLVERLCTAGASAIAVVVWDTGWTAPDGVSTISCDLRDRSTLSPVTAFKADVVFHLAGFSQVALSYQRPDDCFDLNAKGTALLMEAVPDAGAIVYASTAEVYGPSAAVPFVETMAPAPVSPYAISKYAGELLCLARASDGVRVRIARFSNVYGSGQAPGALVPAVIASCLRGAPVRTTAGVQTRDFLHVDDAVSGLLAAAGHTGAIEGAINLCSGSELSVRDLVLRVAALSGTRSVIELGAMPYRSNEVWRAFGDPTKARATLGWSAAVSLDDGLSRTIAAARARAGERSV